MNQKIPSNNYNRGQALPRRKTVDPRSKKIVATHLTTGQQLEFTGLRACEDAGFVMANVSRCCRGLRQQHAGYTWRYLP